MTIYPQYQGLIEKYKDRLPVTNEMEFVSLSEGNTPLIPLKYLAAEYDVNVWLKFDGLNPTGSFKDRGMTLAVTMALHNKANSVICASTGNTSASAAAYASRAGLKSFVIIPEGKIALGKLAQAIVHGAKVIQIKGNFDQGMSIVKKISEQSNIALVNSVNPYRLQGQKTAAFEVCDSLKTAPDYHFLPVGNAGNISAYWMGYSEYFNDKIIAKRPVMVGCQASGSAPFIHGKSIENPTTLATAIRIGNPQSYEKANLAKSESNGWFCSISDEEILSTQKALSSKEGVFCEPASATSVAGLLKSLKNGEIKPQSNIVCTLTGSGLKDTETALSAFTWKNHILDIDYNRINSFILDALDE